jgi:hypothetical protein
VVDRFGFSGTAFSTSRRPLQPQDHGIVNEYDEEQILKTESLSHAEDEPVTLQSSQPPVYLTTRVENRPPEVTTQINEENRTYIN